MRKIFILTLLMIVVRALAVRMPEGYERWKGLPSKELLEMATRYAE